MISPSLDHLPFMLGGADVSITIEQQIPLSGIPRHRRASALADVDRLRFGSKDLSFPPFLLSSSRSRAYVGRARLHLRAPQETNDDQMNDRMQECIDRCQGCQEACLEAISHCLKNSGRHAEAEHIQTLMACAEICDTSARFMLLGSPHHARTCDAGAEVCEACAEDCDRLRTTR